MERESTAVHLYKKGEREITRKRRRASLQLLIKKKGKERKNMPLITFVVREGEKKSA